MLQVVYAGEEAPETFSRSIFLAGPTSRPEHPIQSWRPEALRILEQNGYNGIVFVPEDRSGVFKLEYDNQVNWEHRSMNMSDCILFWVPRDLVIWPAFTTNVEFGLMAHLGKSVFGAPPYAAKTNYLRFVSEKEHIPQSDTLEATIDSALKMTEKGFLRTGGEREVPLFIWHTPSFQSWYQNQRKVGNHLDGMRLECAHRVGKNKEFVYAWICHANIYVTSEYRNKKNEIVIARPDIATAVLYYRHPDDDILDTEVILVREFRSPGNTEDGFIWENPGGSSPTLTKSLDVVAEEVHEETGIWIEKARFRKIATRQLAGTFSAHRAHVYAVALTEEELAFAARQLGIPHGADYPENPTGEQAYTEILTVREILQRDLVDWSNIGMILSALT